MSANCIVATLALLIIVQPGFGQQAMLVDELQPLFPGTAPDHGASQYVSDVPRGVPAAIHLYVTHLEAEAVVNVRVSRAGLPVPGMHTYRLRDVPVEQNTGLHSRTEAWDKEQNPHVIRRAPFRVFEVLEPFQGATTVERDGAVTLRIEWDVTTQTSAGQYEYAIELSTDDWQQTLDWTVNVHRVIVPRPDAESPGYTNWFSLGNVARHHEVALWSDEFWPLLAKYTDLMTRGRQNTFLLRWADFFERNDAGEPVLSVDRVRRFVRLFLRRGFTRIEGGHLAHRHQDDWGSDRLNLIVTGTDLRTDAGRAELYGLLAQIAHALDALDLPEDATYVQHISDEPTDANAKTYQQLASIVRRMLPDVRIFEATMSLELVDAVDIWCPQVQEFQKHRDFFEAQREAGDDVWIYTCLVPGGPWLNRLLDQERLRPVCLGWALAAWDIDGFLHWGLNYYRAGIDPFEQSVVPHGGGPPNFLPAGDSHVVYPGADGPLSGLRFEAHRIGMEDAELLRMLKERDATAAETITRRVFRAFDDYETDVVAYRAARRELLTTLSNPSVPETAREPDADGVIRYTFDEEDAADSYAATVSGEAKRRNGGPSIHDEQLYVLQSWEKSDASVAFPMSVAEATGVVDIAFKLVMNTGTEGAGFAWLDAAQYGGAGEAPEVEDWEAPDLPATFAVGFDASNPPNRDPFRGSGNAYGRPQHEVSLHWDGMEIVKKTTPMDFRDEEPHDVRVLLEHVPGGADVSLWIDEEPIFERYFIAELLPYVGRAAFGARNSEIAGDVLIDDLHVRCSGSIEELKPPVSVVAIHRQLNDKDHPKTEGVAEFPANTDQYALIICTLRLDKPPTRFDPWDRLAHISVADDGGEQREIVRYITPYHRGHVWRVDVTDFRPWLRGERLVQQHCGTQGEGWVVSVKFDFYAGDTDRLVYEVVPLWSGSPEVGNPDKPATEFFVPRDVEADERAAFAKVRTVVTGHGMFPNSNNAAEFMPLGRTLTVNGESRHNVLWKEDNYLNPCRPQGGTWKYDRAGWAPGDIVRPWSVDVSHLLEASRSLKIEYALDEYINENRGQTWAPFHKVEAHLVLYREP